MAEMSVIWLRVAAALLVVSAGSLFAQTPREELVRARKKLRYRYASLADSRFDRALALAEGTLLGFPLPGRVFSGTVSWGFAGE